MRQVFSFFIFLGFGSLMAGCTKEELNEVPVANAGPSQSIQMPAASFTLTGTGADADGEIVAYLWSQVSGPNNAIIVNEGNASTQVTGFAAGNYVFQLMVTDNGGATGVDTVSIHLLPGQSITANFSVLPENDVVFADWSGTDQTNSNSPDWHIAYWTKSSIGYTTRAAFKFDLSSIPAGATIESAQLYLYSYPAPTLNGNFTDANFGSTNGLYLQKITNSWIETGLVWSTQPSASSTGQIAIPSTSQSTQDLTIDVKQMVSEMVSGENNGFLLKLQNETALYNIRIFVSPSNTTHLSKRPKLVVTYK